MQAATLVQLMFRFPRAIIRRVAFVHVNKKTDVIDNCVGVRRVALKIGTILCDVMPPSSIIGFGWFSLFALASFTSAFRGSISVPKKSDKKPIWQVEMCFKRCKTVRALTVSERPILICAYLRIFPFYVNVFVVDDKNCTINLKRSKD